MKHKGVAGEPIVSSRKSPSNNFFCCFGKGKLFLRKKIQNENYETIEPGDKRRSSKTKGDDDVDGSVPFHYKYFIQIKVLLLS